MIQKTGQNGATAFERRQRCRAYEWLARSYRAVRRVRAPQVRTRPRAVVSVVTAGLVDPFPVQVAAEVDVEPANAAALLCVSRTKEPT